jgi:predicted 3-demethylubiquinone-9 3-methyltransferase (glyoxalase superfamily)
MNQFRQKLLFSCLAAALMGCNANNPDKSKPDADTADTSRQPAIKGGPKMTRAATHLMFEGTAEKAMRFYVSLFPGSEIKQVERYGPGEQGAEGTIKRADFILGGHRLICIDSPVKHAFTFTPSMSIFVDCDNEAELNEAFKQLSEGGKGPGSNPGNTWVG